MDQALSFLPKPTKAVSVTMIAKVRKWKWKNLIPPKNFIFSLFFPSGFPHKFLKRFNCPPYPSFGNFLKEGRNYADLAVLSVSYSGSEIVLWFFYIIYHLVSTRKLMPKIFYKKIQLVSINYSIICFTKYCVM